MRRSQSRAASQSESMKASNVPDASLAARLRAASALHRVFDFNSRTVGNSRRTISAVESVPLSATKTSNGVSMSCASTDLTQARIVRADSNDGMITDTLTTIRSVDTRPRFWPVL